MLNFKNIPTHGSLYAGQLAGGALLAASGLFSRFRRWAKSSTGARNIPTHGNESPPSRPIPVDGITVYAVLRRKSDDQMMPLAVRIPIDTPGHKVLRAAYWEIWTHPDTAAFGSNGREVTVEQVAFRPDRNQHLHTPLDALVYQQNLRKRSDLDCG